MANELSELAPNPGSRRPRTRVGRGEGSGLGKTAGRGTKGAKSRAGFTHRAYFEGGQNPLTRRLPKRGFNNSDFAKDFEEVNVGRLASLPAGTVVSGELLLELRIISRIGADGVKVLGGGDLDVALHIRGARLTAGARAKVLAAGGSAE
jgi:large subunit ribosomal protein L15